MERADVATQSSSRRIAATGLIAASVAVLAIAFSDPAPAQFFNPPQPPASIGQPPQGQPPQNQQGRNPACYQLEGQLSAIDRGAGDPARAAQARHFDDAVNRQQSDLDRMVAQSRRLGCQSNGFFSIFSNQPAQCGPLNNQIEQARSNLDRAMSDAQRFQTGGAGVQESQRQGVLTALAQNNCGPQYRAAAAQSGGLFGNLFGGGNQMGGNQMYGGVDVSQGGTYTTLCVRTCDGYYYPISFATTPARFADDEAACKATCPASDAALYTRRTNEDVRTATSISGRLYTDLPNAFRYRQQFDPACSCRKVGQSWADALGQIKDNSIERGDIVVTDEKAKALSQPKQDTRGARPAQSRNGAQPATTNAPPAPGGEPAPAIRSVGPTTNYPTR